MSVFAWKFIEIEMKLQLDTLIIRLTAINNQMRIKRLFHDSKRSFAHEIHIVRTVHNAVGFMTWKKNLTNWTERGRWGQTEGERYNEQVTSEIFRSHNIFVFPSTFPSFLPH